ncbi:MAG TPA: histidine phosphatase family protein [Cellulomonas sp.]
MAATLYLVRHGRTVYNTEGRVQGWSDSPLTDEGLAGVRRTADHLRDRRFVAAWASPSGRTVATAREILAPHPGIALTCDPGLKELNFGDWETLPEQGLQELEDPRGLFEGVLRGTHPGLPGGESGADYLARVRAAFARIARAAGDADGDVLVVSHGVTLLAYLVGLMPPGGLAVRPLPNASVSVVTLADDGTPTPVTIGLDTAGHGTPADPVPAPR